MLFGPSFLIGVSVKQGKALAKQTNGKPVGEDWWWPENIAGD